MGLVEQLGWSQAIWLPNRKGRLREPVCPGRRPSIVRHPAD